MEKFSVIKLWLLANVHVIPQSFVMLFSLIHVGAVVSYYETKGKLYLQSLPENQEKTDKQKQENKLRSRRKRVDLKFTVLITGDLFLFTNCPSFLLITISHKLNQNL